MAGQRMTHPAQSLSRKVTALSDFEYRVWEQTKLSADDFGVLPLSPLPLRADNLRLRKASERLVAEALARLVTDRLLLPFEHQGEAYVCAPAWQTWQMVAFPRRTVRPRPPEEVLAECDEATRYLFTVHPGGRKLPKPKTGKLPNDFGITSEELPKDSRPYAPITTANAHANAHDLSSISSEGGPGETVAPPGAGRLDPPPAAVVGRVGVADRYRAIHGSTPLEWGRVHGSHVAGFCEWVCFPETVCEELARRVPGVELAEARANVLEWAHEVRRRWEASGQIPGDTIWNFWRHEWQRTHGTNRPATVPAATSGLDALIAGGRSRG
jgi:hypothetical protein